MTPAQAIDAEIAKLRDARRLLWETDVPARDVQIATLDAMIDALRWAKDPRPATDRFHTPYDEWCFKYQAPKEVIVPRPDAADYVGTDLEGFVPN